LAGISSSRTNKYVIEPRLQREYVVVRNLVAFGHLVPCRNLNIFFSCFCLDGASTRFQNDERRSYVIREIIETEESYLKNMNVLSDVSDPLKSSNPTLFPFLTQKKLCHFLFVVAQVFARPLRSYAKDKRHFVLGLYECNCLFMNIEMLLEANQAFLDDLYRWRQPGSSLLFGDICATHVK
jgi:hypothetical protein